MGAGGVRKKRAGKASEVRATCWAQWQSSERAAMKQLGTGAW